MSLTFEQIMLTAYREQFFLGQFSLSDNNDGNGVVIANWDVPGVPMPTHNEVMALDTPQLQNLFDFYAFADQGKMLLSNHIESIAKQKDYASAVSCASYVTSTITSWANEATTFIAWRDAVYDYALNQAALMESGTRTIPTYEEFKEELPVIVWP